MREKFASSQFKDFNILDEIYRSRFGIVYKAEFKYDRKVYVLKERKIAELGQQKDVLNEVKLLQQLRNVNIVQCEGWFRDVDRKSLFIVLEYCEGGDLFQFLEKRRKTLVPTEMSARRIPNYLDEKEIWYIFLQICSGLKHLHENGIIHRDIKTLNILLTNNNRLFKIGDLGVSRQVSENTFLLNTFYGTPLYLSPELIENKSYNEKTDIWSLGIILYELCALKPPFTGTSFPELTNKVLRGEYDPIPERYSKSLTSCIGWLLTKEYQKRPNICQVIDYVEGKADKTYHGQTLVSETTSTAQQQSSSSSAPKGNENPPIKKESSSKSKLNEPAAPAAAPSAPPSRPRSPFPPEKKIPVKPVAAGDETEEDIENDSLDGKDEGKIKNNGNSRSRPATAAAPVAGDAVIISGVKKLDINPPKLVLPTNIVPEQQSPNEDSDDTLSVTSQEHATRNSIAQLNRPKSAAAAVAAKRKTPTSSKGGSPQPISIPDEMVEIDVARIHAKHRREIIKYRKLLQMRDFINDSLGNNEQNNNNSPDHHSKALLTEAQQKIAELKNFINILEEAMDKKKILKSIAIRYNLPFLIPKAVQIIPQQEISEKERIIDESLPIYLQQPPMRREQKNIQNYGNPPYSPFASPRRQERNGKGRPFTAAAADGLQVQKEIILQHLWGDGNNKDITKQSDLHVNPHFPPNSSVIVGATSGKEKNRVGSAAAPVPPVVVYENKLINVFDQKQQKHEKHRKDLFHDLQDSPVTPRSQQQQQELIKQYHHQIQQPKQSRSNKPGHPSSAIPSTTPADYVNNDNGLLLPSMKVKPKQDKHSKFIELNNLPVPSSNQQPSSNNQVPWSKPPGPPPQQQDESSSNNKRELSPPPPRPKSAAARVYSRPGSNQRPASSQPPPSQQLQQKDEIIASDKKRLYHHNRVISDVTSYQEVQQVYKDHQANNINVTDLLKEDDENHFNEHLQFQQQAVVGMKVVGESDTTDDEDEMEHHQQRKNFRRKKIVEAPAELQPQPQQQQQQQPAQRPQTSGGARRRLLKEEDENGVIDVKFKAHERKHNNNNNANQARSDNDEGDVADKQQKELRRNKTRIDRMILRKQRSEFNIITGV